MVEKTEVQSSKNQEKLTQTFAFFASLRRVKNHISEIHWVCPCWLLKGTSNSAVTLFIYHCLPALQSIIVFLPHVSKDLIPSFLKKLGRAGLWQPYPDNGRSCFLRECWELLLIICATRVQLTALYSLHIFHSDCIPLGHTHCTPINYICQSIVSDVLTPGCL